MTALSAQPGLMLRTAGHERRWCPRALFWLLVVNIVLMALSGCAGRLAAGDVPLAEPVTESDEPQHRRRARIRLELASGYFNNGQATVALDEIKQALVADPTYAAAYVLRGLVYMQLNKVSLAEDSLLRALQLQPLEPDALHNHGWLLCHQGRSAEALARFDQVLALPAYADQAKTWRVKAICQMRMAQYAEAEASLLRSHDWDPSHPVTAYNLGWLQYRKGDDAAAQATLRRLNNTDWANAESLWLGIRIERRLRNSAAVEQLALQLGKRYAPSAQWALYQRGAFDE
jgi:type IV pilus assembly protein PilF